MKLSNKILIGFFGCLFLYLTAVFAEIRLTGIPNIINDSNSIAEKVSLAGVKHVILNDVSRSVIIVASDKSELEVRSISGKELQNLQYEVLGDSVILSGFKSEPASNLKITVFIPEGLKRIAVNSSEAHVEGFRQENLNISENEGHVFLLDNEISKLQIRLSNRSHLDASNSMLDTLSADVDGSQVYAAAPMKVAQGSIQNSSFLQLGDVGEIAIKKDNSSRLNIY